MASLKDFIKENSVSGNTPEASMIPTGGLLIDTHNKKIHSKDKDGNLFGMVNETELDLKADKTGNVATATKLQTARTINGVSFDGTSNITTTTSGTGTLASGTAVNFYPYGLSTATTELTTSDYVVVSDSTVPKKVTIANFANEMLNGGGLAPYYGCRAWVNFNGTGTVAIRASGNVSSVTDNGTGDYTVNFVTSMPDVNYSILASTIGSTGTSNQLINGLNNDGNTSNSSNIVVTNGSGTKVDSASISCSIFR